MVSFSSAALLLLASAAPAFAAEKLITNYEPATEVADHARIDLDQRLIESQLTDSDGYTIAQKVYMGGAYSKSIATLSLTMSLAAELPIDTKVTGMSSSSMQISGELAEAAPAGAETIKVQYELSNSGCFVGEHPVPITDGCFISQGNLTAGEGTTIEYTYNATEATTNGRTIQGFSTSAESKMKEWPTFQKFFKYYGKYDYADHWVTAAFGSTSTSFPRGNADFSVYGFDGRGEAIKKGTAYMNVWMYVIHEMEDAIQDCLTGCATTGCNDDAVNAWDEAVAFYSGSLEGASGSFDGVLVYRLAEKRCTNMNTCANGNSGLSDVNAYIISQFSEGKRLLSEKKCAEARNVKENIEKRMAVPLVQGTIRYAYVIGETTGNTEKAKAEAAVFAAAVLPVVAACSEADAQIIYDNVRVGAETTNFAAVKQAFENQYNCMGITCEQVGGVWDATNNKYVDGAGPCGVDSNNGGGSSAATFSASAGLLAAGAAALML